MENGNGESGGMQILRTFSTFGASSQMGSSNMRQSFNPDNSNSNKRIGVPPSHPNNLQVIMASRSNSHNLNRGAFSHSRSLSQSAVFSFDCLPPLSPLPCLSSGSNQSDPVLTDISIEDKGLSAPSPVTATSGLKVNNDSLPPRRGHRRSMSDSVPLAFSAMIQASPQLIPIGKNSGIEKQSALVKHELDGDGNVQGKSQGEVVDDLFSAYMNLDSIDTLNSSGTEDKDLDSRASGTKTNGTESSDNEVESRVKDGLKRSAGGDIARAPRHSRSLSMDSYIGNLQFDDESLKFPALGLQGGQQSPRNSIDGKLANFNLEFGNSEFTEAELKKIMANEKLTEIAMADPKRAKRILANRLSAARSKERKTRYILELEQKVQTLQTEATTLSTQVTVLQRDSTALTSQNNELKFCLQAMEQQAKLKDALNEALVAEVQRLRLAAAELRGDIHQQLPINQQMLKLQLQQRTHLNTHQIAQEEQKQL
ncbi:bZIP transcription factor 29 [Ricinus communis]|uniref:bZIP transcription factor 29 n=1 Tax=Ricinus communis TaxID=3988 RepID=UPI00201AAB67|nr:bZIP transcription factor 29 [Ricinus communis]